MDSIWVDRAQVGFDKKHDKKKKKKKIILNGQKFDSDFPKRTWRIW